MVRAGLHALRHARRPRARNRRRRPADPGHRARDRPRHALGGDPRRAGDDGVLHLPPPALDGRPGPARRTSRSADGRSTLDLFGSGFAVLRPAGDGVDDWAPPGVASHVIDAERSPTPTGCRPAARRSCGRTAWSPGAHAARRTARRLAGAHATALAGSPQTATASTAARQRRRVRPGERRAVRRAARPPGDDPVRPDERRAPARDAVGLGESVGVDRRAPPRPAAPSRRRRRPPGAARRTRGRTVERRAAVGRARRAAPACRAGRELGRRQVQDAVVAGSPIAAASASRARSPSQVGDRRARRRRCRARARPAWRSACRPARRSARPSGRRSAS